jgi:four helix bundle suffix protein
MAETIVNIAITLIYQEEVFLRKILEVLQKNFVENG